MKAISIFAILLVGLLLASCKGGGEKAAPPEAKPIQVEVQVIEPDTFAVETLTNGTIIAAEFVELRPEISGRITQINIREGERVNAGELLIKLNDEDLQAQLRKYNAQLDIAEKTVARFKKLLDANGLNQQDYDQALSTSEGLRADIDYVRAQIRKTEIRAPFSGQIGLRNVSPGAYITSQDIVATIQQNDELKVDFVLPESQSSLVSEGMDVVIESSDHRKYNARVRAIEPTVNQGTRNVKFRALVSGSKAGLNTGAFVKVLISGKPDPMAILIPTNCIIADSRTKRVALVKNGKVKMQTIETGYRGEEEALVLSGLSIGDTIAVTGLLFLKPDAPVMVKSVRN